jgi:plastocyanin
MARSPALLVVLALTSWLGSTPAAAASGTQSGRDAEVRITEDGGDPDSWAFQPPMITVERGTTVVWGNEGPHTHTVSADDGSFASPDIEPGGTWRRHFGSLGEYAYHCSPHPWMKGTVRVVAT